jgi:uncharacterized coiled-coil protein SlyX
MSDRYEYGEKEIDSVLRWLKVYDPENATPEKAIAKIEEAIASAHALGHKNPQKLEQLLQELQESKSGKAHPRS